MRKPFLLLLTLVCTHVFCQTQPNIIFITFDDMNDWVQGFNGQPQAVTPNIQYLEKKGTTFLNAYTSSPQCGPSRTSMFTGKDCEYTKIYHNSDLACADFRDNFTEAKGNEVVFTLPQILKDSAGYFTYSISKVFHCHDANADYDSLNPDICGREFSWNKAIFFDYNGGDQNVILDWGEAHQLGVYAWPYSVIPDSMEYLMQDYVATDSAIEFIQNYAVDPANYCDKPFFLGLGFRKPHAPYYIPEKYYLNFYDEDYYSPTYNLPYNYPVGIFPYNGFVMAPQPDPIYSDYDALPIGGVARAMIDENKVNLASDQFAADQIGIFGLPYMVAGMTDEEKEFALAESKRANLAMSYNAAIRFADAQLGRLISELKLHPEILNNTIFVVIGDHGYSLGEKTHWKKGCLWETDIRVPLIITDMRTPLKKTSKRFVSLLDLYPTICDLAGVDYPVNPDGSNYLDGKSLSPLLINPNTPFSKPALTAFRNTKDESRQGSCFPSYSVRNEEWHYIQYFTNGDDYPDDCEESTSVMQEELYHIGKNKNIDPYEWNNLAEDPAYDYIKDNLSTYLPDGINYLQFVRTGNEIFAEEEKLFFEFPNPTSQFANFRVTDMQKGKANFIIMDLTGRTIYESNITIDENGNYQNAYPVDQLEQGYYIAQLQQNSNKFSVQFIVAR